MSLASIARCGVSVTEPTTADTDPVQDVNSSTANQPAPQPQPSSTHTKDNHSSRSGTRKPTYERDRGGGQVLQAAHIACATCFSAGLFVFLLYVLLHNPSAPTANLKSALITQAKTASNSAVSQHALKAALKHGERASHTDYRGIFATNIRAEWHACPPEYLKVVKRLKKLSAQLKTGHSSWMSRLASLESALSSASAKSEANVTLITLIMFHSLCPPLRSVNGSTCKEHHFSTATLLKECLPANSRSRVEAHTNGGTATVAVMASHKATSSDSSSSGSPAPAPPASSSGSGGRSPENAHAKAAAATATASQPSSGHVPPASAGGAASASGASGASSSASSSYPSVATAGEALPPPARPAPGSPAAAPPKSGTATASGDSTQPTSSQSHTLPEAHSDSANSGPTPAAAAAPVS